MKWLNATYIFFVSSNSLVMSYLGAVVNIEHPSQTLKVINMAVGVYGGWSNAMVALIITLAKREAAGKPLVPINGNGGTEFTHKEETTTTTGTTQLPT